MPDRIMASDGRENGSIPAEKEVDNAIADAPDTVETDTIVKDWDAEEGPLRRK